MNDKKLHAFRRQPGPDFTNQLYQQIASLPSSKTPPHPSPLAPRRFRPAWILATLFLMFSIMAMVPGVRARFEEVVRKIGGLTVLITDQYPVPKGKPRIVPDDIVAVAEGRARLDYEFNLPTWVPEGMVLLENEAHASNIRHSELTLSWLDERVKGRAFSLRVAEALPDVNYVVGPNSVTEVMINDIKATLIRGGWYENNKTWNYDISRTLRWQMDGIEYQLSTGNETVGGLSDAELIRVAESIAQP